MSFLKLDTVSVRAQTWLAAYLIRQFCLAKGLSDPRISEFCEYLEELAQCRDIPAWDAKASNLEVTGLNPLPNDLEKINQLAELLASAHEISACQIYGAWQPEQGASFLNTAANIAGIFIERRDLIRVFADHEPMVHGWGEPVSDELLSRWKNAT